MTSAGKSHFEALVREHERMVYGIAYHLLHDGAAAEEVAQDVFLQLHRELPALQSPEHILAWLRRVTCHRAIDRIRATTTLREDDWDEAMVVELEAPETDPLRDEQLRRLVAALPPKMRQVVVLRYQEDLGPEEIARLLDASPNTVKSLLQRALALLRSKAERTLQAVKG
ncbi:MAG TPA: sigma-70 family RNA polymerase sigma factor [Myxococcaceae bacterium]|nr:sigma-70 family RNA polymerase sigma factor [Myxococcaceae bacterium]